MRSNGCVSGDRHWCDIQSALNVEFTQEKSCRQIIVHRYKRILHSICDMSLNILTIIISTEMSELCAPALVRIGEWHFALLRQCYFKLMYFALIISILQKHIVNLSTICVYQ